MTVDGVEQSRSTADEGTSSAGRRRAGRVVAWLNAPLPPPPEVFRRGPLREDAFPSRLRTTRLSSQLGIALAVSFGICFLTGLISHFVQHPGGWFWWPARPVWLYQATQGVHVATGLATIPLLGAKLWSVYPRLFSWPPFRSRAELTERAGIALLVASSLFLLLSGILNVARWYAPMPFFFTTAHYRVAWLAVGALVVHIAVKLPVIRDALNRPVRDGLQMSRRGLLAAVGAAAGVITLSTVGQTAAPLSPISVLAPRRPENGPQGLPVNKTAASAGVRDAILSPDYRLVVVGPERQVELSLDELRALPQHSAVLPIACVEGWSAVGTWSGVRIRDLAELVGVDPEHAEAEVESLQAVSRYRVSAVSGPLLRDPFTLLALQLRGEDLHPDHGFPARLIAPNRPGVMQTKWVGKLTVRDAR
uniref:molybdopterin-dependent oxidoreductase n=1 Tax=Paractinoplanes polyasparticus TaxID=2856853 RepID=UPI001C85961F|nr:molybdopterin-dependent oxidoreductase [Actinoplanes polyasparticus]